MEKHGTTLRLVSSLLPAPKDLETLLRELGAGDHRFRGTSFGMGETTLETYLQECRDALDPAKIPSDKVPQSTFWLADGDDRAVGIARVRHHLNEQLLQSGGHIGYYIRSSERGKGYGKTALRLALDELRRIGVYKALLTVHPENAVSKQIVLVNGGVLDGQGKDSVSGMILDRYWIELK